MFKISGRFFLLFVLVTVLPVFMLIMWNIYSSKEFVNQMFTETVKIHTEITEVGYNNFLKNNLKHQEKVISTLLKSGEGVQTIGNVLNLDEAFFMQCKQENTLCTLDKPFSNVYKFDKKISCPKLKDKKPFAYFDVLNNLKTGHQELVGVFVTPINKPPYQGILTVKRIPNDNINNFRPPLILRITAGDKVSRNKIIYVDIDTEAKNMPLPPVKNRGPFKGHKPPKRDTKLNGKTIPLKNAENKTVAMIEIGIPERKLPFWASQHPPQNESFNELYFLGISVAFLGIILSIISAFYLKKNYIDPIVDLSNISEKVHNGDLSCRIKAKTKEEQIQKTLNNFNKMLDTIEDKRNLHESFVKNLTHDLRTPLLAENRALLLLVEEKQITEDSSQRDLLLTLLKNNEHLLSMVNLLLETYQFEDGQISLYKEKINVYELMGQCISQLTSLAFEKNITLINNIPRDVSLIEGDIEALKRVFINLIGNAIENIPKDSEITIFINIDGNYIRVNVKDNGPGIPENTRTKLFDRYYAGQRTERKVGSGLGLYICKKLIDAHNGNISIDSVVGEYSNFIVSLPLT